MGKERKQRKWEHSTADNKYKMLAVPPDIAELTKKAARLIDQGNAEILALLNRN